MLKNSFEKLSLIEKIELYCIIIIFFVILFTFSKNILPKIETKSKISQIKQYHLTNLENKIALKSDKAIIDYIEKVIEKNNLFSPSISQENNSIFLSIEGSFEEIMNTLNILQKHFILENFTIFKSDNNQTKVKSTVLLVNKYFLNQNLKSKKLQNLVKPFKNSKQNNSKKKKTKEIQLDAIVGNDIFIDSKWYKKGDSIQNYTIIQIKSNFIKILNTKTKKAKIIRLHNDDK